MNSLRWGIVSTGRMSGWFCNDFHAVMNGTLGAVCSRNNEAASTFARQFRIPNAFTDLDEMLDSGLIDVVYIATPHTTHKEIVLNCFDRNLAVLCEKPFVTSVADAEAVLAAADASDSYFMEAMWTWHLPAIKAAKQWVDEGHIGKIVHIKADFGYPVPYSPDQREYDANDAGGALREMGIYPVALMRLFIDSPKHNLHVVHQRAPNGVEQDLTALFDFGDITATLSTSYRCRLRNAAHIIGEDGYIVIPDFFRADRAERWHLDEQIDLAAYPRETGGYEYQAMALGEDVLEKRNESALVTHAKSLRIQKDMRDILTKAELPE
ncbi:MAG: Gfo/Idh/MocA family oxidoreductase [Pseudomonadota bacterium]|nr:Gfo/Idh/MocA family oxidoreductase [Pseudomonadota bacterium]